MDIFIVEPTEQMDVVDGSLVVKEEPEEDPLAGKKKSTCYCDWECTRFYFKARYPFFKAKSSIRSDIRK